MRLLNALWSFHKPDATLGTEQMESLNSHFLRNMWNSECQIMRVGSSWGDAWSLYWFSIRKLSSFNFQTWVNFPFYLLRFCFIFFTNNSTCFHGCEERVCSNCLIFVFLVWLQRALNSSYVAWWMFPGIYSDVSRSSCLSAVVHAVLYNKRNAGDLLGFRKWPRNLNCVLPYN